MSFPLVDVSYDGNQPLVIRQKEVAIDREPIAPVVPAKAPEQPTIAAEPPRRESEDERNAADIQAQLYTMLRLAQEGGSISSAVSKSFRDSVNTNYRKLESDTYNKLDLYRMLLMTQIALSASSGESPSGYISTLSVVLNVMDHIKPQHRRILPDSLKTQANEKLANAIRENNRTISKISQLQAQLQKQTADFGPSLKKALKEQSDRLGKRTEKANTAKQSSTTSREIDDLNSQIRALKDNAQRAKESSAQNEQIKALNEQLKSLREVVRMNSARSDKDSDRLFAMQQTQPASVVAPVAQVPVVDHEKRANDLDEQLRNVKEKLVKHTKELKEKTAELVRAREKALLHNENAIKMQEEIRSRTNSEAELRQRLEKIVDRASKMVRKGK